MKECIIDANLEGIFEKEGTSGKGCDEIED